MRIAVIDDEKYSRVEIIHQIRLMLPDAEICEAANGTQALALLEKEVFDILFIDIHLGDIEGTSLAAIARKLMPDATIVFATAYSEYAVRAFELRVDDYILKPFDPARIRQILDEHILSVGSLVNNATPMIERIAVRSGRHTTLLDISDITYIETDGSGRGCVVHMIGGEAYPDGTSMSEQEVRLSAHGFYRIHKTCLVQLKSIQDIFPWHNNGFALHVRGSSVVLPIGRDRIKELRKRLEI